MYSRRFAFTCLLVLLSAGALGGCASADSSQNDKPAIWDSSSVGVVIMTTTVTTDVSLDLNASHVSRSCKRWSRDTLSAEQLRSLHDLELVERLPRCGADGYVERDLLVIDADASVVKYEVDSRLALCSGPREKSWMLPESAGSTLPPAAASECVLCDEFDPCEEGSCVEGVCLD